LSEKGQPMFEKLLMFVNSTGLVHFTPGHGVMLLIALGLLYLGISKKYEPLLLVPIGFGMLLINLPMTGLMEKSVLSIGQDSIEFEKIGGLLHYLYQGNKLGIFPPLIFMGVGAMTDFGPLIANPKSVLLGAAAQFGIFATFLGALFLGFTGQEAASIGIIGGADGPTTIFLTSMLAPHMLAATAVAAYSYMALVPIIQPPIMKALTTKQERRIVMEQLRTVSKREKIVFPIMVTILVLLFLPAAAPLIGMLMLGNLFKECLVTDRLAHTAQHALINIVTIFLGVTVGASAAAETFLNFKTLGIMLLGIVAFCFGTASGILLAKGLNMFVREKINPLIGSAGVSAVPMAARVSQVVGSQERSDNFLLMHAMGPNVAGVIGSAVAAGLLLSIFGQ
ncbi:MAG: sodium ion-translocating decarboxylase subunit beta, partial [Desulfohalobiaceae bacterium]